MRPVGPSSSHTVGPMRAGKIFINDLKQLDLLEKVCAYSGKFLHLILEQVKMVKITLCVSDSSASRSYPSYVLQLRITRRYRFAFNQVSALDLLIYLIGKGYVWVVPYHQQVSKSALPAIIPLKLSCLGWRVCVSEISIQTTT